MSCIMFFFFQVTYAGEGEPELEDVTSFYTFSLEGDCQLRQASSSSASEQCGMANAEVQQCNS